MTIVKTPPMGESVTEATVARWLKAPGDSVAMDEILCELETDKVAVEVPAPRAGVLAEILAAEGTTVPAGAELARLDGEAAPVTAAGTAPADPSPATAMAAETADPAAMSRPAPPPLPAAARMAAEKDIDITTLAGSGKDGRVTRGDVLGAIAARAAASPATGAAVSPAVVAAASPAPVQAPAPARDDGNGEVVRTKMSRLRQTVARRLKEAQNTAAILTTFNEVDLEALQRVRADYRERFEKRHGVRLGMMGFFIQATLVALKEIPALNASVEGDEIVYRNYYNIAIAVSAPGGLVTPVIRDADRMSLAELEQAVSGLSLRARDGKLAVQDFQGGTFTVSNGGIFGSLMSTPILNPPQSAILGMHRIQDRPVVVNGEIVIRPMMYLALSYDHRLIDGRESVTGLVRIRECLEDPRRLLLNV